MVTYLNCFSIKLADLTVPLRELMKKNVHFRWEQQHQAALSGINNHHPTVGHKPERPGGMDKTTELQRQ